MSKSHNLNLGWAIPLSVALLTCSKAFAIPFNGADPRALGMGSATVAAGNPIDAPFSNPALLTEATTPGFGLTLPFVTAHASDRQDVVDHVRDVEDDFDRLDRYDSIEAILNNRVAALSDVNDLDHDLRQIDDDRVFANAAAGLAIKLPISQVQVAFFYDAQAFLGGHGVYTPEDQAFVQSARQYLACGVLCSFLPPPVLPDHVTSYVDVRGVMIQEAGLSFAWKMDNLGGLSIGISPKYQRIYTLDYRDPADDVSFDLNRGRRDYSDGNIDVGIIKPLGEHWQLGLVGQNLIKNDYKTDRDNTISIKPQARAGLAYRQDKWTLAADLDLTKNEDMGVFDGDTRFASLGGEYRIWNNLALRAGVQTNLADNDLIKNMGTLGVGLNVHGVQFDVGAGAGHREYSLGLRAGYQF